MLRSQGLASCFVLLFFISGLIASQSAPVPMSNETRAVREQFIVMIIKNDNEKRALNANLIAQLQQIDDLTKRNKFLQGYLESADSREQVGKARVAQLSRDLEVSQSRLSALSQKFIAEATRDDIRLAATVADQSVQADNILSRPSGLRALQLLNEGRDKEASDLLHASQTEADRAVANVLLGHQPVQDSIRDFVGVTSSATATASDWSHLSALYLIQGDKPNALKAARVALTNSGGDFEKVWNAVALAHLDTPENTLKQTQNLAGIDKLSGGNALFARAQIHQIRGEAYIGLGGTDSLVRAETEFSDAIEALDTLEKLAPSADVKYFHLGVLATWENDVGRRYGNSALRQQRLSRLHALASEITATKSSYVDQSIAFTFTLLGRADAGAMRYDEADRDFETAQNMFRDLISKDPENHLNRMNLQYTYGLAAEAKKQQRKFDEALDLLRKEVSLCKELHDDTPDNRGYTEQLVGSLGYLATAEGGGKDGAGADADFAAARRDAAEAERIGLDDLKANGPSPSLEDFILTAQSMLTWLRVPGYTWSKLAASIQDMKDRGILEPEREASLPDVLAKAHAEGSMQ